jgi:predicted dehydrogenase
MMSTQKARVAVIGTGWWSTTAHIPALKNNPDAELVALCDRQPERLAKADAAYGPVKTYTDVNEMLAQEKLDGAVICVNHSAHYETAKACLEAGLHVVIDKPMVLYAAHAYNLVNIANARGVEIIMGYPWHYTENTRRAREIVQSGELGAIQYVSCLFASVVLEFLRGNDQAYSPPSGYAVTGPGTAYSDPKLSGGGQGHLQVTHSAGTMFFVTGLQADKVTSFMENFDLNVDLVDAIAVRFKPSGGHAPVGVIGSTGNVVKGDSSQLELQVYFEQGRLVLNQSEGTLLVRKSDGTEKSYGPLDPADRYPTHAPSSNLVSLILGKGENESPVEAGVRTVELLDAAYRSSKAGGQPIRISDL